MLKTSSKDNIGFEAWPSGSSLMQVINRFLLWNVNTCRQLSKDINQSNRSFGLDFIRAMAIVFVLLAHGREFIGYNRFLIPFGFYGVELFFVLSGYLISQILFRSIQHQEFQFPQLINFWIRRWFRTIPNYFLFLFLNLALFSLLREPLDSFRPSYFFFLQNFIGIPRSFFAESWSLCIEEWFYIIFPLTLTLFLLVLKSVPRPRQILGAILFMIVLANLIRASTFWLSSTVDWDDLKYGVLFRLDAIVYGVLMGYLKFYHQTYWSKRKQWLLLIGAVFTLVSLMAYQSRIILQLTGFFEGTLFFALTGVGLSCFLIPAENLKITPSFFTKSVTAISLLSYTMYLAHMTFLQTILFRIVKVTSWNGYILYWTGTLLISFVVFCYFERPLTQLRESYSSREGRP